MKIRGIVGRRVFATIAYVQSRSFRNFRARCLALMIAGKKEIVLLLLSFIMAIAAAEFVVRMFDVTPYQTRLERYQFDETLGWRTRREYSTYISRRRYAHHLYYDNDGFPSDESGVNASASRDMPSIALIGDSFVEGYYLPHEQTLAYLLGRSTNRQILNLGVSGYSPGQYLLSARRHLKEFSVSDVVVFLFAYNDLAYVDSDVYRGYEKPLVSTDTFEPLNLPLEKRDGGESEIRGVLRNALDEFALWSLLKPLFVAIGEEGGDVVAAERLDASALDKSLQLIARIGTEFPDARLHVFYVPELAELLKPPVYQFNTDSFMATCAELALRCVLPDGLADGDVEAHYIPEDRHFSARGAMLVADQVGELLDTHEAGLQERGGN
ncbi:MAG: SGNH/GDSL hydrolase family protein [Gammaproteobacteria bacterium]